MRLLVVRRWTLTGIPGSVRIASTGRPAPIVSRCGVSRVTKELWTHQAGSAQGNGLPNAFDMSSTRDVLEIAVISRGDRGFEEEEVGIERSEMFKSQWIDVHQLHVLRRGCSAEAREADDQ